MNYYNDNDPYCCRWLENLIEAGELPDGYVDNRSIKDVTHGDIEGFTQCHFFAGIGGWPLALRIAGWSEDRAVWTGSCPCQPYSAAGKRKGNEDERNLWPEFLRLIAYGTPPVAFGEQVASKDGRRWLAGVRSDLEILGYGVGAADLCAAGVGAPHIRQRLWWVAEHNGVERLELPTFDGRIERRSEPGKRSVESRRGVGGMALPDGRDVRHRNIQRSGEQRFVEEDGIACERPADRLGAGLEERPCERTDARTECATVERDRDAGGVGNAEDTDRRRQTGTNDEGRRVAQTGGSNFWSDFAIIPCLDGKARRIPKPQSELFCMANGLWVTMDEVRSAAVEKGAQEVITYAVKSQTRPQEVLRLVRETPASEAIQRPLGGQRSVPAQEVLLDFMLCVEAELHRTADCRSSAEAGASKSLSLLRGVRNEYRTASPPSRLEPNEPFSGESADSLRSLSRILAWCAETVEAAISLAYAETLPLRCSTPNRVGRLRAYGNAIVPEAAAAFVTAYLESFVP